MAYITLLSSHQNYDEAQRLSHTRENAAMHSVQCLLHLPEDGNSSSALA